MAAPPRWPTPCPTPTAPRTLCSRSFSLYTRDGARQEAHEAAKFLFNYSHFMQLATCLMHLGQHQAAVDAPACKAN